MAIYRDEIGGFEIDYPATWSVVDVARDIKQQSQSYSITFTSWAPQEPGGQGIPEGGSKVDVSVTKGGAASPEAAAESRRRELAAEGASQITFEEPWDLPGGLAATHWTLQPSNGPAIEEVVTAINGNRILVSGMGDSTSFQQIASTLRPLTPSEDSAVTMSGAAPATEAGAAQGQDEGHGADDFERGGRGSRRACGQRRRTRCARATRWRRSRRASACP